MDEAREAPAENGIQHGTCWWFELKELVSGEDL